jgi:hypothetical protein
MEAVRILRGRAALAWIKRGRVRGGAIVFPQPIALPEGTDVEFRIQTETGGCEPAATPAEDESFERLAVFGIWADRPEMADGAEWVRNERVKWRQRVSRHP